MTAKDNRNSFGFPTFSTATDRFVRGITDEKITIINTSEVFQMIFSMFKKPIWLFGAALKTIYLFGWFRGTLSRRKVLHDAFSSHPKLLATPMSSVGSLRTWGISSRAFIGRF